MKNKTLFPILVILLTASFIMTACGGQETEAPPPPPPPEPTTPPTDEPVVEPTDVPEVPEEPCLIIGALHGGPISDAGYNQAMSESVWEIKNNIPCVEIIEAENVPEEAGATTTMEERDVIDHQRESRPGNRNPERVERRCLADLRPRDG